MADQTIKADMTGTVVATASFYLVTAGKLVLGDFVEVAGRELSAYTDDDQAALDDLPGQETIWLPFYAGFLEERLSTGSFIEAAVSVLGTHRLPAQAGNDYRKIIAKIASMSDTWAHQQAHLAPAFRQNNKQLRTGQIGLETFTSQQKQLAGQAASLTSFTALQKRQQATSKPLPTLLAQAEGIAVAVKVSGLIESMGEDSPVHITPQLVKLMAGNDLHALFLAYQPWMKQPRADGPEPAGLDPNRRITRVIRFDQPPKSQD